MTNLQEDLTLALQRRAEAVTVENHLDAILDDVNIIRFSSPNGADPRRSRVLLIAVSVAVLVGAGGLIWATNSRTQPTPASSSAPAPLDTSPGATASVSNPGITPGSIPTEFPNDVPRPDTYELMTVMTADNEPVGWEFYDRRGPTDRVERCTQYASAFDASWTSTPKTDEHESVLYAQVFDNGQWQVGIYCINDGGYLVQVVPTGAILPSPEFPGEAVPSIPTASLPDPNNDATCASGGLTAVVPLVVGMSYDDAARTLEQAGFGAEPTFENSPASTARGDDPVVNQLATGRPVPLEPATCGLSIRLTVAFQPGPLHLVQNGETYPSIAEAEGIDVDDLLAYNGLTRDELGSQGRSIDSPLMAGEALRLQ